MNTQTTSNQTSEKPTKVRLLDLKPEQFLAVCYTSKKLTDAIDKEIGESWERDIEELIFGYLRGDYYGAADWSFGMYSPCHLTVEDADKFLDAMANKVKMVCATNEVIASVKHCEALRAANSNLWRYTVENELKEAVYNEAKGYCDWYEEMSMAVYNKDATNKNLQEYVENEIIGCERYPFETLILDLTTGEVHDEQPETTLPADQLEAIRKAVAAA